MLIDIRSMNLSYFYQDKKKYFEKKEYFKILEENYKKNKKNNFELLTEFFIVSGWKHHISQQTPLMPGEAKNNLGDFLK